MRGPCRRVKPGEPALPRLAQRRQGRVAVAVERVKVQLLVDIGGERHGLSTRRLRHDAVAHGDEHCELRRVKRPRLARHCQAPRYHFAGHVIP